MLPPVLEVHVVWHPKDTEGQNIAQGLVDHFHGTAFSGLIGGAIEVYVRSAGWTAEEDAPRPIPFADHDISRNLRAAKFVVVVPLVGNELAMAVGTKDSVWQKYLKGILAAREGSPKSVAVFPYLIDQGVLDNTEVGKLFGGIQAIGGNKIADGETPQLARCRDLTQSIARLVASTENKLTIFISHTKRHSIVEGDSVEKLIALVREVLNGTRLGEFFDASDLQPGEDWDEELRKRAATSAMLVVRTDLYPSREWCQREVSIAKRAGMPVLIMDALGDVEERGSFLMDHVQRVPARFEGNQWKSSDIHRALALLVDECAKRSLWDQQKELAAKESTAKVAWWAPHAPEPITFTHWLKARIASGGFESDVEPIIVLHPDPPLGGEEKKSLDEILEITGIKNPLEVLTPRLLAARGG